MVKKVTILNAVTSQTPKGELQQAYSIGGPVNCSRKGITNLQFSFSLVGFKGDYVALLVPREDYVAYFRTESAASSDSYCRLSSDFDVNKMLAAHKNNEDYLISVTNVRKSRAENKRYAAFSVYGEYIFPIQSNGLNSK